MHTCGCQSSTVASYLTVCKKVKETNESKKYFFEIKPVSRVMCQQKCRNKNSVTVCYKIPNFTDSCERRILHDSVTVCVAKFLHELATSKLKMWQSFGITSYTLRENVESVK